MNLVLANINLFRDLFPSGTVMFYLHIIVALLLLGFIFAYFSKLYAGSTITFGILSFICMGLSMMFTNIGLPVGQWLQHILEKLVGTGILINLLTLEVIVSIICVTFMFTPLIMEYLIARSKKI